MCSIFASCCRPSLFFFNSRFRRNTVLQRSNPPAVRGFTLVELMVAMAILAVLATIALPAYNVYTLKSKFAEVLTATNPTKTAIATCAADGSCIYNGALNLGLSSSLNPTLGAAYDGIGSPNQYATLLALHQAFSEYNGGVWDATTVQSVAAQAQANGQYVVIDPNGVTVGEVLSTGNFYDDSRYPPFSLFMKYYVADNTALIALPCVGNSGCTPSTKYTATVGFNGLGVITGTAVNRSGLQAETVVLTPSYSSGRIDWSLSGSCKTRSGGALC